MRYDNSVKAIRGSFFDYASTVSCPADLERNVRVIDDGLMIIRNGLIEWIGEWADGKDHLPAGVRVRNYSGKTVMPGFIDTHLHFPQCEMIGAYGEQLLEWLNLHTFPVEMRYHDYEYAREMATFFLKQMLSNGTTTASVFASVHPQSVDALCEAASRINMRLITGKVMMDRHAPDALLDTPETGYRQSRELIERWHKNGRLLYAVTPRFAPTSTPEQLAAAGRLRAAFPDTWMQTHLSENQKEIEWVKALFPGYKNYLDVYHEFGLTGPNSVFGHCIHLEQDEWDCLSNTGSTIAFCPTSNFFLGSGLFPLHKAWEMGVKVGIGTDIGAGTTFNMLQTLNEAYKVMQMQGHCLSPFEAFYLATLGGADSLGLADRIGSFEIGKEADFVVIDHTSTPMQQLRCDSSTTLREKLFVLMTLGDDRAIYRTYVDGQLVYERY
ncbi:MULTISPECIES: guanine deaminase [unclassified Paludibacterium]|uniref:guanine deaminase n=1 Tax=unclassified Paludibacterium TaxID=2618429 RepID=UPI001C04987F|nr:guanine deaminase [Paludibacterium sp. B53371]BEV71550.1 guanine deaminase [Paludibacterium sp. THUN1379]